MTDDAELVPEEPRSVWEPAEDDEALAAERTELAWGRSALALIVCGLAVARGFPKVTGADAHPLAGAIVLAAGALAWLAGIPYARDIPDKFDIHYFENPRANGPFGAAGVGELPLTSPDVAIINAIYHATGVRIRHLPARPEKVLDGLKKLEKKPV